MRSSRPLTWFIIVVQLLFLWWLIAGMSSTSQQAAECAGDAYKDACEAGTAIGGGIAFFMIILLWALIDVILGVIWVITNKSRLPKPPKGSFSRRCTRCSAVQNVPINEGEFECWQCKLTQSVIGAS